MPGVAERGSVARQGSGVPVSADNAHEGHDSFVWKVGEELAGAFRGRVAFILVGDFGTVVIPHVAPDAAPGKPPSPPARDLLTVREVADLLQLTPAGIYAMVAAHRIPFVKVSNRVRFARSDVVAWLQRNRVPSRGDP